jgi:hypothetical protein
MHSPRLIIEHINPTILMSTCSKSAISTHINTHAKATLRLELPDLLPAIHQVPDIYSPIICCARQILTILVERNSPDLSSLIPIYDFSFLGPFSRFRNCPYLHFAAEPCTYCVAPVARSYDVMAAQLVRASDGLCQGIVGGRCGVHFYG